jgi:co-chaperonin GroES (HSP10)
MKLEALYNAVIVKPVEAEETSYGGIIVPDLGNEKNKLGKVVAVGDGYYSVTGHYIETVPLMLETLLFFLLWALVN